MGTIFKYTSRQRLLNIINGGMVFMFGFKDKEQSWDTAARAVSKAKLSLEDANFIYSNLCWEDHKEEYSKPKREGERVTDLIPQVLGTRMFDLVGAKMKCLDTIISSYGITTWKNEAMDYSGIKAEAAKKMLPVLKWLEEPIAELKPEMGGKDPVSFLASICQLSADKIYPGTLLNYCRNCKEEQNQPADTQKLIDTIRQYEVTESNLDKYVRKIVDAIPMSVRENYPEDSRAAALAFVDKYYASTL